MTNPTETSSDAWEPCPPGELHRLVNSTRMFRRARTIRRSVLAGGAATIVAFAAWITVSQLLPQQHCIAGLYCKEVRLEMPDLIAMRLAPERAEQLKAHIALCADCRRLKEAMESKKATSFDHYLHDGNCPHCNRRATLAIADAARNLTDAAFIGQTAGPAVRMVVVAKRGRS